MGITVEEPGHPLAAAFEGKITFRLAEEIFWNPMMLRFYLDGIQFACGDLEAPMMPR